MPENLPNFISWLFILTVLLTFLFFISAVRKGNTVQGATLTGIIILIWIVAQSLISGLGFYLVTKGIPPRFIFLVGPPFLLIILLFATRSGRHFIDSLSLPALTQLHVVRLFVEIILYWLFIYKLVPQLMTFEGRNFDILAGITAPVMGYLVFIRRKLGRNVLLAWNIFALMLLINIVLNAILSAPFPFQRFAFDQPNRAVLYFPFALLPGFIVPVVLFSHLVSIRRLLKGELHMVNKGTSEAEASMMV